jgi:uroporphyrinogen III methyltransferase/synthase
VVGDVVRLRSKLNFFEERKLYGKKILVPKIGSTPSRLASLLREQGAAVQEIRTGEIETLSCSFTREELQNVDWMIFTSTHGIDGFFENLKAQGMDARALSNCRIAVVGRQTANHLQNFGITADFIPKEYNSISLGKELIADMKDGTKIWYSCAVEHDGSLKEILGETCEFMELPVYENKESTDIRKDSILEELQEDSFDAICFTSASTAARVFKLFGKIPQGSIFSIGPKCSEKLKELGVSQVYQAEYANYQGVVEKVLEILE